MPASRHRASHKAKSAKYSQNLREQRVDAQRKAIKERLAQLNPNALSLQSAEDQRGYAQRTAVSDLNPFAHLNG